MQKLGYLHDIKFLIVDDNTFMRELLHNLLHHFDVRVIREASDGAEALETLQGWSPDIILLDWEMKPFDGIEFTRMVRASTLDNQRFIPIIMVSGHSEYWRIQHARNAGVNEFLVKPLSAKALFSRIRAVIERPRPFIKTDTFFGPDRRRQNKKITGERRKDDHPPVQIPGDQTLAQDQINAIFNPGSDHPDEIDPAPNTTSS